MNIPAGIENRNNSCYAISVIQCLRRIIDIGLSYDMNTLDGNIHDASEFYTKLVEKTPFLQDHLMIRMEDNNIEYDTPILHISPDGSYQFGEMISHKNIVVTGLATTSEPVLIPIREISHLEIGDCKLDICAVICYTGSHYYALVEWHGQWYHYNDDRVHRLKSLGSYPVTMAFYKMCMSQ